MFCSFSSPVLQWLVSLRRCYFITVCSAHVLTLLQDEVEEEIEEDDSYLDLAGMKQQSQMNVSDSFIFICTKCCSSS